MRIARVVILLLIIIVHWRSVFLPNDFQGRGEAKSCDGLRPRLAIQVFTAGISCSCSPPPHDSLMDTACKHTSHKLRLLLDPRWIIRRPVINAHYIHFLLVPSKSLRQKVAEWCRMNILLLTRFHTFDFPLSWPFLDDIIHEHWKSSFSRQDRFEIMDGGEPPNKPTDDPNTNPQPQPQTAQTTNTPYTWHHVLNERCKRN